jgi:type I restriction enzyme S subunit
MSETLEAMARALFKAWFVDFEPVRAKHALSKVEGIEGRWQRGQSLPGLPAHLYDLFPDRLVDSALGEIPQGWELKIIDDLAEIIGGSTPSTVQPAYWDDGIHCWATPKDLSALKAPVLLNTERRVTDAGLAQISSGLLPKGTVLLSSRAPIGYLAIAEVPVAINQGFVAMKPRTGVPNLFLLLWARAAHEDILARANGSTFLEISKANFRPLRVAGPPLSVLDAFERTARPLYEHIVSIVRESSAIAALRDTLLPKLISGDLRVPDAEHHTEASV